MTYSRNVSLSIIEAIQRLSEPLVFIHPSYAIAAIPRRDVSSHTWKGSARLEAKTRKADDKSSLLFSFKFDETTQEASAARQLFNHLLRRCKEDGEEGSRRSSGRGRSWTKAARVLMTSTMSLILVAPFVTAILYFFMCHHRHHLRYQGEGSIMSSIQGALQFLLRWSYPALGVWVSASAMEFRLKLAVDVLYSSPLLIRPWTENAVLVAMACAPEWSLRELSGSGRIATWVHRYITTVRLNETVAASRLVRWNWLEGQLHSLMPPEDIVVFARTLCALLIALELELVVGEGSVVVPRDENRDGEGLVLLLTILKERRGDKWMGKSRKRERGKASYTNDDEYYNEENDGLYEFDTHCSTFADKTSIDVFLREQLTCVDFVTAAANDHQEINNGSRLRHCGGDGNRGRSSKASMITVRRLCGIADELYRFLSEWIRLIVNTTLGELAAQVTPSRSNRNNTKGSSGIQLLQKLTIVVGRAQKAPKNSSQVLPLFALPVNLFGDILLDEQQRRATPEGCNDSNNIETLNCAAANSFFGVCLNVSGQKAQQQGVIKGAPSLLDIPLWPEDEDENDDSEGDDREIDVLVGSTRQYSSWFTDIIVNGAVRYLDQSPAQWQRRANAQLQEVVTAAACPKDSESKKRGLFVSLRFGGAGNGPLLRLRHALTQAHYALSPWHILPSLPSDVQEGRRGDSGRLLREFLDPKLLQQSGLLDGRPLWTTVEIDYINKLQRGYGQLLLRAVMALDADVGDTTVGVHIIPAPMCLQQPSAAELMEMEAAVNGSLLLHLLPQSTRHSGRFHVAIPFSVFSARYSEIVDTCADRLERSCRVRQQLPDRTFVEGLCIALKLPSASFRLLNDMVELTLEGQEYLTQRLGLTRVEKTVREEKKEVNGDDDNSGKTRCADSSLSVVTATCGAHASHIGDVAQRQGGVFASFELRSCGEVEPLTLEEWSRAIDDTLLPPSSLSVQ